MKKIYDTDEVLEMFLSRVNDRVDYWRDIPNRSTEKRLEGLAFSILSLLDGESIDMPRFIVAPDLEPDPEEDTRFPDNSDIDVKCDIGGMLHEHFFNVRERRHDELKK